MDDKSQLTVESMRLLQDWSKWLITLETVICASLWPKLTAVSTPLAAVPKPHALLYVAWIMFWLSIITAAILLISISSFVRRANISGEKDLQKVKVLVAIEYSFFLGGLFCFGWRMFQVWLNS